MREYPDFKMIREALSASGFRFTRRWGQNFLTERQLLSAIVVAGEVSPSDLILEIGTGPGCLTFPLLRAGPRVIGIEIDKRLHEIGTHLLREKAPEEAQKRMTWLQGDFLADKNRINEVILASIQEQLEIDPSAEFKVVANLPYSIAVPAIMNIMEGGFSWKTMVVTIQQELADRFSALPGTKSYGAVRVLTQALAKVQVLRKLPPEAFWPKPKVSSCVVKFSPRFDIFNETGKAYSVFKEFTRRIFAYRRKTWSKSLKTASTKAECQSFEPVFNHSEISTGCRAEDLNMHQIFALAELFSPHIVP
ncbi:MAG: ribosomal RNA small subunit methyltransferase A [Planctomycetes bacterium]|nr:ribosomal RNA small subunit methyltransferase A [Planctomycetota bacterium]